MYAEFDDSLLTGDAMIDGQHRELIGRIHSLQVTCENEKPAKREAIRLLDYLADYIEYHFAEEEKLQEEIGYPGLAEHKKKHQELRQSVAELYEMLEDQEGPTDDFAAQVHKKVAEWLYGHIQGFDRSVAEYQYLRDNERMI